MGRNILNNIFNLILFSSLLYSNKWVHQTGGEISDIKLYGSNKGLVFLNFMPEITKGILKKTEDAGNTWETVLYFDIFPYSAREIEIPDSLHIFCLGAQKIFRSKDGGNTWDTVSAPSSCRNMSFIDSLRGWIVGIHKRVYFTQDGGLTWNLIHSGGDTTFKEVKFLTSKIGFLVETFGGAWPTTRILKTIDGGYTWTSVFSPWPYGIRCFDFCDSLNGYVVIYDGYVDYKIYRTSDGGNTWTLYKQFSPNIDSVAGITCIQAVSPSEIWLGGWGIIDLRAWICHNTGNSWEIWLDNFHEYEVIRSIYFSPSSQVCIAGDNHGTIYKSINSSTDFSEITAGIRDVWEIDPLDTLKIWAVGRNRILFSKDGGKTWHRKYQGLNYKDYRDIEFVDSLHGWVTVPNSKLILKTIDGGNTWTIHSTPEAIFKITFIDTLRGWGCGGFFYGDTAAPDGWIYKTMDGGITWQLQYRTYFENICDIIFVDENNGWAVGGQYNDSGPFDGIILHTSNGGNNWNLQYSQLYIEPFEHVDFVDQYFGWVPGCFGGAYFSLKTEDGGNTWIEIDSIGGKAMSFLNRDYGWGITKENGPAYTLDGGNTWHVLSEGFLTPSNYLNSLKTIHQKNGCWAGTSYSGIYRFYGDFLNVKEKTKKIDYSFFRKIDLSKYEYDELLIIDASGRRVFKISHTTGGILLEKYINKRIPAGCYILKVKRKNSTYNYKLILF